jgi:hypothetical protein
MYKTKKIYVFSTSLNLLLSSIAAAVTTFKVGGFTAKVTLR